MYVHPRCKNFLDEIGKYRRKRDPKNLDRILEDIEDRNNHAMDACRYCTYTRFGGPDRTRHESGPGWGTPQAA
jgi:phage terminase large subunit